MFKIYYLVSKNDPLKFWNLEIIGNSFTVIYCDMVDLHTETEETQVFETDEICFQKAEKLLCEKLNSEYQEANPKTLQRIDQLEDRLGSLAMKYRACDLESEEEKKIISEYHKVLNILFGRDLIHFWSQRPDHDSCLPDELMPKFYRDHRDRQIRRRNANLQD
ncbi:hypothetical protein [Leptospira kirschneri]|uniref:Uncharacterized protein n=1 Tax=Leptospira kirschneri str. 200802841 TaxID=1193047 RepID=A0A828XWB0_9LEPT|nr:hypothetical protein [Leptospira kirschneri]EMO77399.1 hypothetical protein LEP1GSC127_2392 [Leptospira kirschneri str. 200801925]EKO49653.1 hypothetical protein LEP1GSC131_4081 [Leptospira kirschneri str. 200802841]EKQ83784.1 hypothetical protein LEP1GSC064_0811 [Leptospira kirschneri serovar Grippotyphosa str. Moskva]EKR08475.1 hypothetical protein LEP1GSC122_1483 [Leptospira kirschneri serovar Valbuzzi str. 200702274]EMK03234.1 hypothetical protein LEP1GSC176_2846 [Leptospira kirschneri 